MRIKLLRKFFMVSAVIFTVLSLVGTAVPQAAPPADKGAATAKKAVSKPKAIPKKDIKGIVVDMLSGAAIPDATVSLLKISVKTGPDGRFIMKGVPESHDIQMTARITTDLDIIIGCSYFFVPTIYYPITASNGGKTDIQIINMIEDVSNVVLRVGDYTKDNIDQFCQKCHEGSPCLVEEEYGRIADGKVKLKGLLVRQSELEAYIEKMKKEPMTTDRYSKIRYLDSHPSAIDITATDGFVDERVVIPEDLVLKEDKIITCDTCHTRHVPTEWNQFVIMDFLQVESICIKCHR